MNVANKIALWGRNAGVAVALLSVAAIVCAHFSGNDQAAETAGDAMFFAWVAALFFDVVQSRIQR